ncbi:MAG TPA: STAS domain-containing protein [Steroidobacteraceae bacterium]|nr:STAS domain-containing protein [Steroidobacteraceae bacterium]
MTEPARVPGATGITVVQSAPNRYEVRGALAFGTARRALGAGLKAFAGASGPIEVDLSGVGTADSAGLAVLIEWLAWAHRNGREVRFSNVPQMLDAIARICELEGLLQGK